MPEKEQQESPRRDTGEVRERLVYDAVSEIMLWGGALSSIYYSIVEHDIYAGVVLVIGAGCSRVAFDYFKKRYDRKQQKLQEAEETIKSLSPS